VWASLSANSNPSDAVLASLAKDLKEACKSAAYELGLQAAINFAQDASRENSAMQHDDNHSEWTLFARFKVRGDLISRLAAGMAGTLNVINASRRLLEIENGLGCVVAA
jgi:hypothetical protein